MTARHVYVVLRREPDLALITRDGSAPALWTARRLRRSTPCAWSGLALPKGARAYGPTGNQMYRMERIDADVIEGLR